MAYGHAQFVYLPADQGVALGYSWVKRGDRGVSVPVRASQGSLQSGERASERLALCQVKRRIS